MDDGLAIEVIHGGHDAVPAQDRVAVVVALAAHGAELAQRRLCVQCPSHSVASLMMASETLGGEPDGIELVEPSSSSQIRRSPFLLGCGPQATVPSASLRSIDS